jgi:hypothetical protein
MEHQVPTDGKTSQGHTTPTPAAEQEQHMPKLCDPVRALRVTAALQDTVFIKNVDQLIYMAMLRDPAGPAPITDQAVLCYMCTSLPPKI